jgi:hypothetical protein
MKIKMKILLIVAFTFMIFNSCNDDKYQYKYDGPTIVQFTEKSGTFFVLESADANYKINFQLIGSPLSENISIPFEFVDTAEINGNAVYSTLKPEDGVVSVEESELTVSSGEFFGELTLKGVYNKLDFGKVDTMLIKINDGATTKVDPYNNVMMVKVQKYYPYVAEEFVGTYHGDYTGNALGGFDNWGETSVSPGLTLAIGEEPNTLVITSGFYQEQVDDWGETWTDGPYPITIYMNTDDPTNFVVEIPEIQLIGTTDNTYTYYVGPYPEPGQFNAATKELTIMFNEIFEEPGGDVNDTGIYTVVLDAKTAKMLEDRMVTNIPVKVKK